MFLVLEGYKGTIQESHLLFLPLFLIQKKLEILLYRKKSPPTIGCSRDGRFRSGLPGVCSMLKTRVNGTVRPEMDAGLRRGIAAAVVLLIVCVLAVGAVSAADTVTVSSFDELQRNISSASGDWTIIVTDDISITRQLTIDRGQTITLTTNDADHTLSRDNSFTGNLFTVNSGGSLTITGNSTHDTNLTLDGMKQSPSNNLVKVSGSFTLADGGILTNNTAFSGGGVYVFLGGTFTMSGGTISDNTANNGYGGGVYVMSDGSTFEMSGGTISGNTADDGGGVYMMSSGSTFEMSGDAVISGNTADDGGGVYVMSDGSTFEMFGGTISGNTASNNGGGVYVKSGEFTMSGGEISNNKAEWYGGGVYEDNSGTFGMSGDAVISGNTADYGGGVYLSSGTFEMSGNAAISGNTAVSGGGVYVSPGTFEMSGGELSGNTATKGGGVYLSSGTFEMSGDAVISGNTASNNGGGVCMFGSSTFKLSGSGSTDSVYLASGKSITVTGELTATTIPQVRGIEFAVLDDGTTVVTGTPLQESYLSHFKLDSSVTGFKLAYQSPDSIVLKVQPDCTVQFDAQGGSPEPEDVTVSYGGMVTEPAAPAKTGYTFTGWFKDTVQWNFETPVTSNMILYANWTANMYTVTFDAQGGSAVPSQPVVSNTLVTKPADPTKTGFTFTGWYNESSCVNLWDFNTPVTGDITLYAGWNQDEPGPGPEEPTPVPSSGGSSSDGNMENAFRVLFNDGATTLTVQTDLSYGDTITKPADPVKDGYTFAGWYKDEACTQPWDFETGIPGDMTLYAKWTAIEATPTATATATAVTTPQPTKTQSTTATTSAPQATTAAAVSPTLVQTPAPVAGALFGLLAAGVLLRRRLQ